MTTMSRVLIAGSIVVIVATIPFGVTAQSDGSQRFQRAPVAGRLQTTFLPRAFNRPPVTVVVVLAGQSVADVQEAAGRRLTRQEKDSIKAQRRVEQAAVQGNVQALGGRVIGWPSKRAERHQGANSARANETLPADPAMFGPGAPKVKGGTDLVGDDYDADGDDDAVVPHPDPNPLDCNGHGSHVAGTAAGFGVVSTGSTYPGRTIN